MLRFQSAVVTVCLLLMTQASVMVSQAVAQDLTPENGLALAAANRCISCHQVDRKVVGPAFQAISERFSGQSSAQGYLAESIQSGSVGRWGPVPMPRQSHVSPADAQALAGWILSLTAPDK